MIPSVLRPKMWKYNYGKRRAYSGKLSFHVVDSLYPEKKSTFRQLWKAMEEEGYAKNDTRVVLYRLKNGGLVTRVRGAYLLTELGRWFAISHKLDLSFLELCVLASACCVHTRYAMSGKPGFYLHSYFERPFREYYSKKYIPKKFSVLIGKGYASRLVKKTIRVRPRVRKELMEKYGPYFERMEKWLDHLEESELEIFGNVLEGFSWDKYTK